jgi:hypothetical protein
MTCAVEDKPAILRFQRSAANPKRFLIRQILTGSALVPAGGGQIRNYDDRSIGFDDVSCPHCSAPHGTLYCYTCRSLICRGGVTERDSGIAVTCRPSCRAVGFLTVYRTEYETRYDPRICIGHLDQVVQTRRVSAPGTGNFFDCCDQCDATGRSAALSRRRER